MEIDIKFTPSELTFIIHALNLTSIHTENADISEKYCRLSEQIKNIKLNAVDNLIKQK